MATEEPKREKLRNDNAEPNFALSRTESENKEPNLDAPKTATVAPRRIKLRRAKDEPK
jgi:hypothetical protein